MSVFDPNKSSAGTDTIVDWCRTEGLEASDDIKIIPGVGAGLQVVLRENGIDTIAQVLGKFLMCVDGERDTQAVCQAFYDYMKSIVKGTSCAAVNMHAITFSMANFAAEKKLFVYDL
mmetsp:Transcript_154250/g.374437  ORF Transcript_154250/g.374437 Transcript_154250/m.374437 type:complete len:117 (-) Transcript_154250:164-514(-)